MTKIGVSLKIDVTKIDKARLFEGQKGKYLDATVFIDIDQQDQYGNSGMITQDVTKEEKNQGVKGNILGNCKVFWNDGAQQQPRQQQGGISAAAAASLPTTASAAAPSTTAARLSAAGASGAATSSNWGTAGMMITPFAPIGLMYSNVLMHCI